MFFQSPFLNRFSHFGEEKKEEEKAPHILVVVLHFSLQRFNKVTDAVMVKGKNPRNIFKVHSEEIITAFEKGDY